nr:hypothetical protein [Parabacteroides goldsteinii]
MELDELKHTWDLLNRKLEEDKSLKESLILEVIRAKADKSVNKLVNYDILSFVLLILLVPFIAYAYFHYSGQFRLWDIYTIYAMAVCLSGIVWYVLKIRILMKVDLSQKISANIYYTNRYNILVKREKLLMNMIVGPVFPILAIFMLIEMNSRAYLWIGVISLFVLASMTTYWSYKRIYDKNISSILKSLGEIKDLEEKE